MHCAGQLPHDDHSLFPRGTRPNPTASGNSIPSLWKFSRVHACPGRRKALPVSCPRWAQGALCQLRGLVLAGGCHSLTGQAPLLITSDLFCPAVFSEGPGDWFFLQLQGLNCGGGPSLWRFTKSSCWAVETIGDGWTEVEQLHVIVSGEMGRLSWSLATSVGQGGGSSFGGCGQRSHPLLQRGSAVTNAALSSPAVTP